LYQTYCTAVSNNQLTTSLYQTGLKTDELATTAQKLRPTAKIARSGENVNIAKCASMQFSGGSN